MTAIPALKVQSDPARNLLTITYHGVVTAAVTKSLIPQAEKLIANLKPGFTVLTDLSGLESMAVDCVPHMAEVMELCKARGIGMTIRVIPNPRKDIGLTIMANIHYGAEIPIVTCRTMAEAEAAMPT